MIPTIPTGGVGRSIQANVEYSRKVLVLRGRGLDGTQAFVDESLNKKTATGVSTVSNLTYSTTPAFFPPGAINFPSGNVGGVDVASHADFAFGTGDYSIRIWMRPTFNLGTTAGTFPNIIETRSAEGAGNGPVLYVKSGPSGLCFFNNGANRITTTSLPAINTATYVEISRVSGTTRLFVGGTQVGSSYTDSVNHAASRFLLGNNYLFNASFQGQLIVEVINGAGGNTANYTPPAVPFGYFN